VTPELACIVLAHGPAAPLGRALDSLRSQEPGAELVVAHSGGPAPEVPEGVALVHHDELLLPGGARNRGVAATRAPFVAFLAMDCVALPGWVSGRLREHAAGADAVADMLEPPSSIPGRAAWLLQHRRRTAAMPTDQRHPHGLSYRRELLLEAGPFREDLRQGEDTALNEKVLEMGARVAYPTDVRIVHGYPESGLAVLSDSHGRGRRRVAAERAIGGLGRRAVLRQALWAPVEAARLERDVRVLALVAASSAAYTAGVLRPAL
jgi:hypothetical protein